MDWIEDFKRLYFSFDINKRDEALYLKRKHIPRKIYSYCKINDYFWENISDRNINGVIGHCFRMTNPTKFNDPYDTLIHPISSKSTREYILYLLKKRLHELYPPDDPNNSVLIPVLDNFLDKYLDNGTWLIDDLSPKNLTEEVINNISKSYSDTYSSFMGEINRYGVKCFSTRFDSILMWSHYADRHTGVCFEYDLTKIANNSDFLDSLYPVSYGNIVDSLPINLDINIQDYISLLVVNQSIAKATDWKYESEWRFIKKGYSDTYYPIPFHPSRVFLGARIKQTDVIRLRGYFEYSEIPFIQLGLSPNSFKLVCNSSHSRYIL